jgi:hypothetical protein
VVVVAVGLWWQCSRSGSGCGGSMVVVAEGCGSSVVAVAVGCGGSVVIVAMGVCWQCGRSGNKGVVAMWS